MTDARIITKSQLIHDLRDIGLTEGQAVILHVSVKAVGWVVGGPEVVLQALFDTLSPSGTIMMLAEGENWAHKLAEWPPERQEAYRRECPGFDPARSRVDHRGMSILAEYLRTWPGAFRSRNPLGFAAAGRLAEWITRDEPWRYRNGPGSPLAKLCEAGGKVLVLGASLNNISLFHHAEHMANVPNKRLVRFGMPVMQDGRRVWMEFEEYDTSRGIVDWPTDYFIDIGAEYVAAGNGRKGFVGAAQSYLFDAASLKDFAVRWMEQHFTQRA